MEKLPQVESLYCTGQPVFPLSRNDHYADAEMRQILDSGQITYQDLARNYPVKLLFMQEKEIWLRNTAQGSQIYTLEPKDLEILLRNSDNCQDLLGGNSSLNNDEGNALLSVFSAIGLLYFLGRDKNYFYLGVQIPAKTLVFANNRSVKLGASDLLPIQYQTEKDLNMVREMVVDGCAILKVLVRGFENIYMSGGLQKATLREIGAEISSKATGIASALTSLCAWHEKQKFCSYCGSSVKKSISGWTSICDAEKHIHYPRIDNAIIVAVLDSKDRLLIGHNTSWDVHKYSILAGFVDAGESLETAVVREVWEETGIQVERVQYVGSQPWPFPRSLMSCFIARAPLVGGKFQIPRADKDELDECIFISKEEFRKQIECGNMELPGSTAVSYQLINQWLDGIFDTRKGVPKNTP